MQQVTHTIIKKKKRKKRGKKKRKRNSYPLIYIINIDRLRSSWNKTSKEIITLCVQLKKWLDGLWTYHKHSMYTDLYYFFWSKHLWGQTFPWLLPSEECPIIVKQNETTDTEKIWFFWHRAENIYKDTTLRFFCFFCF